MASPTTLSTPCYDYAIHIKELQPSHRLSFRASHPKFTKQLEKGDRCLGVSLPLAAIPALHTRLFGKAECCSGGQGLAAFPQIEYIMSL